MTDQISKLPENRAEKKVNDLEILLNQKQN